MRTFHAGRTRGRNPAAPVAQHVAAGPRVRGQTAEIRHILGRGAIQPKLRIGAPDDACEREADRAADRVMAGDHVGLSGVAPPGAQRMCAECEATEETVRRQVDGEEDEEELLQAKTGPGGPQASGAEMAASAVATGGRPLSAGERAYFEPRFGRDFSPVRVHDTPRAHAAASAINARAFTTGRHMGFAKGQYSPHTEHGRRLLAHELTHVVQNRNVRNIPCRIDDAHSSAEVEADRVSARLVKGLPLKTIAESNAGIALTPASRAIEPLISYSAADWEVTDSEEASVLAELRADPDLSATINDLDSSGMLGALIGRVDEDANRRELLQMLGHRLNAAARTKVEPHVGGLERGWQLQFNLGRLGVTSAAPAFDPRPFAHLISGAPGDPFTGSGATGVSPTTLGIPILDQARLAADDPATVARYSNPLPGSLPAYLSTLSATERAEQAELLLRRPISSVEASSFGGNLPSRAQVIRAAARAHDLHPQMLAGFLLAEQRDQSRNEDAKDYLGATSILSLNLSIGLGQVVISTARRDDLFSDLLSSSTRSGLGHDDIAELLASDEFNIFAAARYIRKVADDGSALSIATLPDTQAAFPGINLADYAGNSSTWPDDNIRALASEYTSRPWDDSLSTGWADFVFKAYNDVNASGVF